MFFIIFQNSNLYLLYVNMSKLEWKLVFIQMCYLHDVKQPGFKAWFLIFNVVIW